MNAYEELHYGGTGALTIRQTSGNESLASRSSFRAFDPLQSTFSATSIVGQRYDVWIDRNAVVQRLRSEEKERAQVVEALKAAFHFEDEDRIRTFLAYNQYLLPILQVSLQHLKASFGAETLILRASTDEEGFTMLHVKVLWPGSVSDARAARERFDDEWWIAHAYGSAGKLMFTYELV